MKKVFIAILMMVFCFNAVAQTTVKKKIYIVGGDTLTVYRQDPTGENALLMIDQYDQFRYGKLASDESLVVFKNPPEQSLTSVNAFVYFNGDYYAAGAGWPSGVYSYKYDPNTEVWTANPFGTDGPIQLLEQAKKNSVLLITGGFSHVGGLSIENTCMMNKYGVFLPVPNNDAPLECSQQSGSLLITSVQGEDIADHIRITDMDTWTAVNGLPEFSSSDFAASGICYDPKSQTYYASLWQPYTGSTDFRLSSAKIGDAEWTDLLTLSAPMRLEFQNGFVVCYGATYSDGEFKQEKIKNPVETHFTVSKISQRGEGLTTTTGLFLYQTSNGEVIDPFVGTNYCPPGTAFIDGESKGVWIYFSAWYLEKSGDQTSYGRFQFLPSNGEKVTILTDEQFSVYPSPATDWVTVEGLTEETVLTDLFGRSVKTVLPSEKIYVGDLPNGIYLILKQKVVVQH